MLEEIGFEYAVKKMDLSKGDQFKEDFKEISPFSKIPAIVENKARPKSGKRVKTCLDEAKLLSLSLENIDNFIKEYASEASVNKSPK